MFNIAVIGAGRMGKGYLKAHQTIRLRYPVKVSHICDIEPLDRFNHIA